MKKLVSIITLLTLVFYTFSLYTMEKNNIQELNPKEQDSFETKIQCKDEILHVNADLFKELTNESNTLQHLCSDIENDCSETTETIPLHDVKACVLKDIITLITLKNTMYTEYTNNLSQRLLTNLIELLQVANFLDMKSMIALLSTKIAHKITQETKPSPQSFLKQLFFSKITLSNQVCEWLSQNKNKLQLSAELINIIALKIIKPLALPRSIPQRLKGHTAKITCTAWSPTGTKLISASEDKTIRVWTLNESNTWDSQQLTDDAGVVRCLAWNPADSSFISGNNNIIILWKLSGTQWQQAQQLIGHTDTVTCFAFSSDGKKLISASKDNTVRVWTSNESNTNTWTCQKLTGYINTVTHLAFSPDDKKFIAASKDNTIRIWTSNESDTWTCQKLIGHKDVIRSLSWNPNCVSFISTSHDNTLRVWTLDSLSNQWQETQKLIGHTDAIKSLGLNHDDSLDSDKTTVKVWTQVNYNNTTLEQSLLFLIWHRSQKANIPFEIPQELQKDFDEFPEVLKDFLTQ